MHPVLVEVKYLSNRKRYKLKASGMTAEELFREFLLFLKEKYEGDISIHEPKERGLSGRGWDIYINSDTTYIGRVMILFSAISDTLQARGTYFKPGTIMPEEYGYVQLWHEEDEGRKDDLPDIPFP